MTPNQELDNTFGGEDGVSPIRFGLRDADRVLGHSLSDEAYRRPTYDFYRPTLAQQVQQAAGCLAHMVALLVASLVIWGLLIALFVGATNV